MDKYQVVSNIKDANIVHILTYVRAINLNRCSHSFGLFVCLFFLHFSSVQVAKFKEFPPYHPMAAAADAAFTG